MKQIKGIFATSNVDSHNMALSLEALEMLVEQINNSYIPVGVEHDPRIPPIGRNVSAKLIKQKDGSYAVEGISEIFEEGDYFELKDEQREMPVHNYEENKITICFDRSYYDEKSQILIKEIGELFNTTPEEELKKAAEPLSILTIGAGFVLGAVATGFLKKLGADAYGILKDKLKELLNIQQRKSEERLLVFSFTIKNNDKKIASEIILSNPTNDDIDSFFKNGFQQLDKMAPNIVAPTVGTKKIVFEYSEDTLSIKYAVRKDAVPFLPTIMNNNSENPT